MSCKQALPRLRLVCTPTYYKEYLLFLPKYPVTKMYVTKNSYYQNVLLLKCLLPKCPLQKRLDTGLPIAYIKNSTMLITIG